MAWPIILALVLVIPLILIPVAFVWYLNVSGLYQVMRVTRERQKRRAETLREAEGLSQGKVVVAEEQLAEAAGVRRTA